MENAYKWLREKKNLLCLSHRFIDKNCVFSLEGIQRRKWKDKLIVMTVWITWTNIFWETQQNSGVMKVSSLLELSILSGFLFRYKFISIMKFYTFTIKVHNDRIFLGKVVRRPSVPHADCNCNGLQVKVPLFCQLLFQDRKWERWNYSTTRWGDMTLFKEPDKWKAT